MVDHIINSTPLVVDLGRDDRSTEVVTPKPLPRPTHCPLFYLYTEKGKAGRRLVDGATAVELYGAKTFDTTSPYYNHATAYATAITAEGNSIMLERIEPADSAQASAILWAEIANQDVPVYKRDAATGKVIYDSSGQPQPELDPVDGVTPLTIDGYKIRWSLTAHSTAGSNPDVETAFGGLSPRVGTLQNKDGSTATAFPIMEVRAASKGAYGNLTGVSIFPAKEEEIPQTVISGGKFLPFFLKVVRKKTASGSVKVVPTKYGEKQALFSWKKDATDPGTTREMDLGKQFISSYSNEDDTSLPLLFSDFDDIHVYYENIETILNSVFTKETAYLDSPTSGVTVSYAWYDFANNNADESKHLMNILTAQSSKGVPYFTLQYDNSNNGLSFTSLTNHFMANGSDGTMSDTAFAIAVGEKVEAYLDPNSPVQDNALNVESCMYDSGFPLDVKKKLLSMVAKRKDTWVTLTPHVHGVKQTLSDIHATGVSLMAAIALFPDSAYYGTPQFRALIVGGSGVIKNHPWKHRVGANYEIAVMSAKAMGASSRIWDLGAALGRYPGNVIRKLVDIEPHFVPASTKYSLWDTGIIWPQPYDATQWFFPGIKTVYTDETSVLNNYLVMAAVVELDKIAWDAWRRFTNTSCASDAQLAELVTNYVNDRINDINSFDGCIQTRVLAFQTKEDSQRGYSWHLTIQVGGPNLKTVETIGIETYRLNNLPA